MDDDPRWYVTQRYPQLQGYRLLPLSLLFAITALWEAGWVRLPGSGGRWFMAASALALTASWRLGGWYAARFARLGGPSQRFGDSAVLPILLVAAALPLAALIERDAQLPFSLPMATVAAALAGVGLARYPLRSHYLAAAALPAGLALEPLFGVTADAAVVLMDAAIAGALAIIGVGDHRLLVTSLHRVRADV